MSQVPPRYAATRIMIGYHLRWYRCYFNILLDLALIVSPMLHEEPHPAGFRLLSCIAIKRSAACELEQQSSSYALVATRSRVQRSPIADMTPRELDVLREMAEGSNNAAWDKAVRDNTNVRVRH